MFLNYSDFSVSESGMGACLFSLFFYLFSSCMRVFPSQSRVHAGFPGVAVYIRGYPSKTACTRNCEAKTRIQEEKEIKRR